MSRRVARRHSLPQVAVKVLARCDSCSIKFPSKHALTTHQREFHKRIWFVPIKRVSSEEINTRVRKQKKVDAESEVQIVQEVRRITRTSSSFEAFTPTTSNVLQAIENASKEICRKELESTSTVVTTTTRKSKALPKIEQSICQDDLVFFDLETGGLSNQDDILEIAAAYKQHKFNIYVTPTKTINKFAAAVNHLTFKNGKLYYRSKPVQSVPIQVALDKFLTFLEGLNTDKVVLVAHNAKFDSRFLLNFVGRLKLEERLSARVIGFLDTIPVFKYHCPRFPTYKQEYLVGQFLSSTSRSYDAHNALSDVLYLQQLYDTVLHPKVDYATLVDYTHSTQHAIAKNLFTTKAVVSVGTFGPLVERKVVSKTVAIKLSDSNIRVDQIESTFHVDGEEGVKRLLSTSVSSGTKSIVTGNVVAKILSYFRRTNK